jgi:hypothetical protein
VMKEINCVLFFDMYTRLEWPIIAIPERCCRMDAALKAQSQEGGTISIINCARQYPFAWCLGGNYPL